MEINYDGLWKLLIDKKMNKTQLSEKAGITTNEMAKMGKNEMAKMETLVKICKVLDCQIEDVIDKAKKIKDANDDIKKIDDILNDSTSFHHKADNLYEELVKNLDYSKYIMAAKIAKGMAGKIPFKQLPFLKKRNVFAMIRESISAYILNELTEKEENK